MDCLIKDNGELKGQVAAREAQLKEVEDLKGKMTAMEVELAVAREEWDEATTISRTFEDFIGNSSDVVNKPRLYDEGMSQPRAPIGPKIVRFLVDYNTRMEMLLKGMRALLQPAKMQG